MDCPSPDRPSVSSEPLATSELFRTYSRFVHRLLLRLGLPAERADDALQDVFLTVHRRGGYQPGAARPTTYLAGIAVHVALTHHRKRRTHDARWEALDEGQRACTSGDPTRILVARQELERIRTALGQLPEPLRATLMQIEVAGESCVRVAAEQRVPVGTVYSRLHSAHKRLRSLLPD